MMSRHASSAFGVAKNANINHSNSRFSNSITTTVNNNKDNGSSSSNIGYVNEEGGECLSFTIGHIILDPSSLIAQDDVNNPLNNEDCICKGNETNNSATMKNNDKLQVQSNICETEVHETKSHVLGQYRKEIVIKDAPLQISAQHLLEV